jgi:large subunit ribosomal protein L15
MLSLNNLREKAKATKARKRVARGISGKRAGHGENGQKGRSGVALGDFQGGQNPIARRLPKQRSFFTKDKIESVSVNQIKRLIESNKLSSENTITYSDLMKFNVIKKKAFKVIGVCDFKVKIEATSFSKGAESSINTNGGVCKVLNV